MENIISLTKRRGFIYPGSEIYGGLGGTWDYGPLGVLLKNNVKDFWWKKFVLSREDMFGLDSSILLSSRVWESSGHLKRFGDKLVECKKCHKRFREDHLETEVCPECGGKLTEGRQFNTMFKTSIGPVEESAAQIFLRPETAQGIFVNFKNVIDSFHPKIPFGIAQIGKAFRNEITPQNFIFRTREFEQMEIEYFIKKHEWEKHFDYWLNQMQEWISEIGISSRRISNREIGKEERAHYSERTVDIDYDFPFGRDELFGIAYRTDFDLKAHGLSYYDEEAKKIFVPHVIEPTFGVERAVLALLCDAYDEDEMGNDKRVVLKLHPKIAPVKIAVFPLLANKPDLVNKAREIFEMLKPNLVVWWDDIGNIGKRYRRQDEIGTPWCVTVDFETLENNTVTIRDRDTGEQERIDIGEILEYLQERL
jgi:glycyl-tRNA synthetase